jgi:hypothetical protein
MTQLVRLYPRPWRDRYEAEVLDLLEQRPPSIRDAVDLVRGALDAHLHPQAERESMPWTHRLPGLAILATGLLWIAAVATARDPAGTGADRFLGLAAMTVLIGLPGDYLIAFGRRIAAALGVGALGFVLMFSTPWALAVIVFLGVVTLVLGGTLTMVAIRAGIASGTRWRLLIGLVVAPVVVGAVVSTGLIDEATARLAVLLALPYGVAWILIGVRLIVRGSPTIIDPPTQLGTGPVAREIPA